MTEHTGIDEDLVDMVDRFFAERSGHEVVFRAEQTDLDRTLWEATAELGLPLVGIDEEAGGSGGSTLDAMTVLRITASHAVPLPLAETYLAGWVLAEAGIDVPDGPLTFVQIDAGEVEVDELKGTLKRVPWARIANSVVIVAETDARTQIGLVSAASLRIAPGADLAGQPSDEVSVEGPIRWVHADPELAKRFARRAALARSAQIAGGLQAIYRLTAGYVQQRHQFGRPIGAFQSVQQHIVSLAQAAEMTALVLAQATLSLGTGREGFEVAATKLIADQSAAMAARTAHAAHGAIGMTQEYRLQQLTRRLHAWRLVDGNERDLATSIGAAAASALSMHAIITGIDKEPMS